MVDCGECVELGINVLKAPSEVGGVHHSEVMACSPSEWIRGAFYGLGEYAEELGVVFGRRVTGSVPLAGKR